MNTKIGLEPSRGAGRVKHPKAAAAVLFALAGFAAWLASENYVWAVPLTVIFLIAAVWNWRRRDAD